MFTFSGTAAALLPDFQMNIGRGHLSPLEQTHHPLLVGLYREKVKDGIQGTVQVHE